MKLKNFNLAVMLFFSYRNFDMVQWEISILSVTIGENERCLFSLWRDYTRTGGDILFFHI